MNWAMLISALVVAAAMVISAKELARGRAQQAVANMAALLASARLTDGKYVERVERLRNVVRLSREHYPDSSELGRKLERDFESDKEELRETDYMKDQTRQQWVDLAATIFREVGERLPN